MTDSDVASNVRKNDALLRQRFPQGSLTALLHIGEEETTIALGSSAEPGKIIAIPVGSQYIATQYFKHSPPTPLDLENAIVVIEDAIAGATEVIGTHARLYATDDNVRDIARQAGINDQPDFSLSRDAVENLFGRLAAVAEGQPIAYAGMPIHGEFLAALLILRELMHHLHFNEIFCTENRE